MGFILHFSSTRGNFGNDFVCSRVSCSSPFLGRAWFGRRAFAGSGSTTTAQTMAYLLLRRVAPASCLQAGYITDESYADLSKLWRGGPHLTQNLFEVSREALPHPLWVRCTRSWCGSCWNSSSTGPIPIVASVDDLGEILVLLGLISVTLLRFLSLSFSGRAVFSASPFMWSKLRQKQQEICAVFAYHELDVLNNWLTSLLRVVG